MKFTIDIEATPQEVREFLGLPDVRPLQEEMMKNFQTGAAGFDPGTMMKMLFPAQMQSMETLQKAFWDSFSAGGASGAMEKAQDRSESGETSGRRRGRTASAARDGG